MYLQVATLTKLRSLDLNKCNIVQWNQYFIDRGHICLEFEHLDKNLVDFMKEQNFRPLLLKEIRPIVQQVAHALKHLKAAGIVHADLKLDNVMLVDQLREPYRVKVIDFGLACQVSTAMLGSYVQTRPYRSPEILLGNPFTDAIDMWSLGCMAAAMYLGTLLYPGLGEYEMIKYIMETQGQLPVTMLNHGLKTPKYFRREVNSDASVWKLKTPDEYRKETGMRPMENRCLKFTSLDHLVDVRPINTHNSADRIAEISDVYMFVDMLKGMLQLDPNTRATPCQVLEHKFISMLHFARMDQQSSYICSCFQMMEVCQKEIQTSDSTAVCGPLVQHQCTATNLVQQNPPSYAEWRKTSQPQHTGLLPCTSKRKIDHYYSLPCSNSKFQGNRDDSSSRHDSRTRPADHHQQNTGPSGSPRTEGQAQLGLKRKAGDHDDVPSPKRKSVPWSHTDRRFRGNRDDSSSRHDSRTRPADHHQHNTGPSGSPRTEGQAQLGLKRKAGDHDDVPSPKRNSVPWSHTDRRFQGNRDDSTSRHDSRTRPADHHQHNTGPSGSPRTEGQAQLGLKRKAGDHDDVPSPKRKSVPCSHTDRRFQGNRDDSTSRHDSRTRPADHHQHNTGPSGSPRTEGQAQLGLKRKAGDHDDVPSPKRNSVPSSHTDRRFQGNRDDSTSRHDSRTRPADHHQHNTGPSGSPRTEDQAQLGLKRKEGDHDDVPSPKRNSVPCSHTDRRFQGNRDDSTSRHDSRTRPADHHHHHHHHHHNTGPSGSPRTEGQAQSGLKRKAGDHDDVPSPKRNSVPCSHTDRRFQGNRDDSTSRHDSRTRPADHHQHNTGPSGSPRTEDQAQSGLKRKEGDHDDVPSPKRKSVPWSHTDRRFQGNRDDSTSRHDSRTRPADHHQHNTGPSGSPRTEDQAQSGLKRKEGDHDDVPSPKRNSVPCSHTDRRFQGNRYYSKRRDYERKRGINDGSTCRDDHCHTRHSQPDQRTRPAEHHHHNTGPSGSTGTESRR
ncbi:filaggrin-like [Hippoglossus stenolepis]|uniref:filaggrin-like n=1 Tax=Hippoglossus stenolepis TaxID=195615 RepID=UPI001FB03601|nr:filaggrin-like [Hippoglossus stenolepis]